MRIALAGLHPDGVDAALAFAGRGHTVPLVTLALPDHQAAALGGPRVVRDLEEILADPSIEAVIVAGPPGIRVQQLRRVLQSERHALCVHPLDARADAAYEMSMLAGDGRCLVLPLLREGLHPAIRRLAEVIAGDLRLVTLERRGSEVLLNAGVEGMKPSLPCWDILRAVGGEVAEVSAYVEGEEIEAGKPVLVAGRYEKGGTFQMTLLPGRAEAMRLVAHGSKSEAELDFPQGMGGPAILSWGENEEYRETWDGWAAVAEGVEGVFAKDANPQALRWQEEVRCLELDDAARHSAEKGRTARMEYQEANEEVGFKGTMALVGCAMMWLIIGLLIASRSYPWAGWLILPLLLVFGGLQLLRYIIPPQKEE